MRRRFFACLSLLVLGTIGFAAPQRGGDAGPPAEVFGVWSGTWEGGGTGSFELTLEKGKDGAPAGRVAVTGEPTYQATLKTLAFEGKKLTATYDLPIDEQIEIVIAGAFEGAAGKGTWLARQKGGGAEAANGTWTVSKK